MTIDPFSAFLAAVIALAAAALVIGSTEENRMHPAAMKALELLGLRVRDRVTGFVGVVESISFDLYGCVQAVLRGPVNEKNEIADGRWFDISRLEVVDAAPVMEIPGGRFSVTRSSGAIEVPAEHPGPAEKPAR